MDQCVKEQSVSSKSLSELSVPRALVILPLYLPAATMLILFWKLLLKFRKGVPALELSHTLARRCPVTSETRPGSIRSAAEWQHALRIAGRMLPFEKTCLIYSLALRTLLSLKRIPHRLQFGIRTDPGGQEPHAWIEVGAYRFGAGDRGTLSPFANRTS